MTSDSHTAAPSAAGYLYQARLALALALRYTYIDASVDIGVEKLDDVSFEVNGTPLELLQAKHHIAKVADLSDASVDLWKSLRIWCQKAKEDPSLPQRMRFALITTGHVLPGSVAHLLRPTSATSSVAGGMAKEAAERLTTVAQTSTNKVLQPAFDVFLGLSLPMRASVLSAIQILDGQPRLDDLAETIEQGLRMVAPRGKAPKARELLEGWWWGRICGALVEEPVGTVSVLDLEAKLDEIRESLHRDSLPVTFEHAEPPEGDLSAYENYSFVDQLKAVGIGGNRIEYAKRDFYRAFSQRSQWAREYGGINDELFKFEATLIEEWQPRFQGMCDKHSGVDGMSPALRDAGQELYYWVETGARFPFRSLVKRFLNVGSYHMLADRYRVGWHRDYLSNNKDS